MTCEVCPNCGLDLERFEPVQRGDLTLGWHEASWKGVRLRLSANCRLLLRAIVRGNGAAMSVAALAEAMGCIEESRDWANIVAVQLSRVRRAFRDVDPGFDAIHTEWGAGVRWVG